MSRRRISNAIAAMFLSVALPALAQDSKAVVTEPAPAAASVPDKCGGNDMLAELAVKEPAVHKSILDAAAATENGDALFWKVEKPGVPPSYLFGTIHMSDVRVSVLPDKIKSAFDGAKTVALEVANTSDAGMIEAMSKVPDKIAYLDGKTLQSQLTAEEFEKVKKLVGKYGMPGEAAVVLRPWIVSLLLAMTDCQRAQMAAGKESLDTRLETEAKKRGATVVGLETAEGQLKAMAEVPDAQQIQMLKSGLDYFDRADDLIETLVQMYLNRRIGGAMPFQKALAAKSGIPASAFEGFNKILLVDRNVGMRDAAKPLFDKGEAFVAVGALHLTGKQGLVQLLRDAGYTVTKAE